MRIKNPYTGEEKLTPKSKAKLEAVQELKKLKAKGGKQTLQLLDERLSNVEILLQIDNYKIK